MELDYEKQAEEFNNIWANRRQPPIITTSWIDNDWAKGRRNYLTFLIRVHDQDIIDEIKQIQSKLAEYDCIDPLPAGYFHMTVKELDAFLVPEKKEPDEYTEEEIPALIESAREKLADFKPFEGRLGHLNNFKSVVCVQVHDGGQIRELNSALMQIPGVRKLRNDYPRFLPHVSIALYKSSNDYDSLINHLEGIRDTVIGKLRADTVELVIAELPRMGEYPKLKTVEEFRL